MKKVYDYLTDFVNLSENDVIVVGVSAGPDSMALLYILLELRKKINFKIIVAHVNHNVRIESKEEAEFLENYCEKNNLVYEYMIISKYGDDNFHNEARNIRYEFYKSLINKYHANYLMTGHHGDDLMETILMRIVRGSSLKGYSGFASYIKMDSYTIVRPLIYVTKDDIANFLEKHHLEYRVDKSNFKDKYTRNRYRKNILPFLKQEDKLVHEKFLKFSHTLMEYDEFIENIMDKYLDYVYCDGMVDINRFKDIPSLMQKRIIDYLFERIYLDDLFLINDRHQKLFLDLIYSKKANITYNLPNDYLLIKAYDKIYFKKLVDDLKSFDMVLDDYLHLSNGMTLTKVSDIDSNGNDVLRLLSSDVSLPLRVRNRRDGDRIKTFNGGTKKVKDIFIEKKIPIEKRDSWPIVVDSLDRIVWIPKLKKSKFNRLKSDNCDIIFKCN